METIVGSKKLKTDSHRIRVKKSHFKNRIVELLMSKYKNEIDQNHQRIHLLKPKDVRIK